jgi:hypothetical protein
MRSAVLFLVFSRPDTTRQVFEAIRAAQPPRLYVAADGPRTSRKGEKDRCEEVRRIATAVDWPCIVKTLFRDENLGCKLGVSGGIDWFFANEEEGIIIEDDVLPLPSFFPYCDVVLEKYRNNEKIAMISGCNLISHKLSPIESYFFSRNIHIWGWASWRRAWRHYDVSMKSWPQWRDQGELSKMFPHNRLAVYYWDHVYNSVYSGKMDTWDYQWHYICWRLGALSVWPSNNLTRNLGFGRGATNTVRAMPRHWVLSAPREMMFPLVHPKCIEPNQTADVLASKYIYNITTRSTLRRWIRGIPVLGESLGRIKRMWPVA